MKRKSGAGHWPYSKTILFVIGLLTVSGCGPASGTVSGKVSYRGKSLRGGTVTLIPEKGGALSVPIQPDGSYSVPKVPVGPVKIGVETKSAKPSQLTPTPFGVPDKAKSMLTQLPKEAEGQAPNVQQDPSRYTPIPDNYANPEKSGLTYTVQKGLQVHDIDMK